jgi:hypothetical protein
MERSRSESRSKQEEDLTAQTKASYDVERAKLDYSAKDILPRVDAEQRRLKVGDAQHKLREADSKLTSDKVAGSSKELGIGTKRTKSQFDLDKANRQLNSLSVSAPSDGIVTVLRELAVGKLDEPPGLQGRRPCVGRSEHRRAARHFFHVWLGAVDEVERGRMAIGQRGTIRVEALPIVS